MVLVVFLKRCVAKVQDTGHHGEHVKLFLIREAHKVKGVQQLLVIPLGALPILGDASNAIG